MWESVSNQGESMKVDSILIIFAAEAVAVCLLIVALLFAKNRKQAKLIKNLQKRLKELVAQVKQLKSMDAEPEQQLASESPSLPNLYADFIDQEIDQTRDYHDGLGAGLDIALDLDPDAPLLRRTAALRNAFLIAEKEASNQEDGFDWDSLATRYQQILSYNEDYSSNDNSELIRQQLQEDLANTKKRVANLEKFKTLYIELEEKWEKCKAEASEHYVELQTLVGETDKKDDLEKLLERYHASYKDLDEALQQEHDSPAPAHNSNTHALEIERLKNVAAEQHKIITELQAKLSNASTEEEKSQIVDGLQKELQKQARFLQESETCVKLLEDELNAANEENDALRSRADQLPQLKSSLKELQKAADTREQMLDSLKTDNRRLNQKLQEVKGDNGPESGDSETLKMELTNLQSKYNDLEEKFLNLKLKG